MKKKPNNSDINSDNELNLKNNETISNEDSKNKDKETKKLTKEDIKNNQITYSERKFGSL